MIESSSRANGLQPSRVPAISIVMPCFNAAEHLPKSVGSILAQTLDDWELIAVDDGSRDDTAARLDSFHDPRIHVIRQPNAGVSRARNRALASARGQFVAFLDADDTWHPTFLERMLGALIAAPGATLAYCGWQNLGRPGQRGAPFVPPDYEGAAKMATLLEGCRWPIHASLTRRDAIQAAGSFDGNLRIGEDYLLWLEVAARGQLCRVPEVLAFYHHHDGVQATHNLTLAALDTLRAKQIFLGRHPEVTKQLGPTQIEALTWGTFIRQASMLYWQGDLISARPLMRKALLAGHGSLREKLRMLPSLCPMPVYKAITALAGRIAQSNPPPSP